MAVTVKPLIKPITKTNPRQWATNTLVLCLLGYAIFLVGMSTFSDYRMKQQIANDDRQIAALQLTRTNLQFALIYYQSDAFKEIEARQLLLMKGANEHVVALPNAKTPLSLDVVSPLEVNQADNKTVVTVSPVRAWWNLFFSQKSE